MQMESKKLNQEAQELWQWVLPAKEFYLNEAMNDHREKKRVKDLERLKIFDFFDRYCKGEMIDAISESAGVGYGTMWHCLAQASLRIRNYKNLVTK